MDGHGTGVEPARAAEPARAGPTERLTVVIAEDHTLVREGTRQILVQYDDVAVVGEAARGDEAVDLVVHLRPRVGVFDLRLPGLTGIEAAQRLAVFAPDVRVLILTAYDEVDYVLAALEAGVAGYLLKTAPGRELVEAVRAVGRGETVLQD